MKVLMLILAALLDVVPAGKAVLRQLQPRDSILIADQVEYGFQLDDVPAGTALALPDFTKVSNDTLTLVRGWQLDTLSTQRARKGGAALHSIRGSIILAPFEEGHYRLPEIPVLRAREGADPDTLLFEALEMDVKTMPVDTATFEVHDLKGQMTYPLTFK